MHRHVLPLWSYLFQEVVYESRLGLDVGMVTKDGRRLQKVLLCTPPPPQKGHRSEEEMKKVLVAFGAYSHSSESTSNTNSTRIPAGLSFTGCSPEVTVSLFTLMLHNR